MSRASMPRWSAEEKDMLRDLYHKGLSDEEIAEKIGRTKCAVANQRHELDLPMHNTTRFEINDAMADYYPAWYREKKKREWEERYTK